MTNKFFPEIKGKFGFGCMRLPMAGSEVDMPQFREMVDAFLDAGLNYFDTAHGYLGGLSETALREALTSRYPREKYILTNKLSTHFFTKEAQIQFNYVDYEDPSVESRKVYETAAKHGKPVIVMEPVKGGSLVNLPDEADRIFRSLGNGSNASYALRFAAGFDNMMMVLSGMSTIGQLQENVSFMAEPRPLNEQETEAVNQVRKIFSSMGMIPCTACHYCVLDNDCPKNIQIPELFSCYNLKTTFHNWNQDYYYENILTRDHGKASDCLKCGKCERICPQHLPIRELLEQVAAEFE